MWHILCLRSWISWCISSTIFYYLAVKMKYEVQWQEYKNVNAWEFSKGVRIIITCILHLIELYTDLNFLCSFVFRFCKTLARQTRLRMRSSRSIYKILTLSKSMPPDFTRISITTSDVSEVSEMRNFAPASQSCHARTLFIRPF